MTQEVRRPLSPGERWYWIAEQIAPLNVIVRVHLTGRIPDGLLERAAANLAAEHPLLRVAISANADGTNPVFAPALRSIPVRMVRGDDTEWESRVDHELTTSMDWRSGPLVRIVDVVSGARQEEHDLVLTVSHIIADATAALSLLRRLVEHADGRLEIVECPHEAGSTRWTTSTYPPSTSMAGSSRSPTARRCRPPRPGCLSPRPTGCPATSTAVSRP